MEKSQFTLDLSKPDKPNNPTENSPILPLYVGLDFLALSCLFPAWFLTVSYSYKDT